LSYVVHVRLGLEEIWNAAPWSLSPTLEDVGRFFGFAERAKAACGELAHVVTQLERI
jgi:hypothetical protein